MRCYCGKEEREVGCGEGEGKECMVDELDGNVEMWLGQFQCENDCDR